MFVGNDFFRTDPMAGTVGNVFWEFSTALLLYWVQEGEQVRGRLFASFNILLCSP